MSIPWPIYAWLSYCIYLVTYHLVNCLDHTLQSVIISLVCYLSLPYSVNLWEQGFPPVFLYFLLQNPQWLIYTSFWCTSESMDFPTTKIEHRQLLNMQSNKQMTLTSHLCVNCRNQCHANEFKKEGKKELYRYDNDGSERLIS